MTYGYFVYQTFINTSFSITSYFLSYLYFSLVHALFSEGNNRSEFSATQQQSYSQPLTTHLQVKHTNLTTRCVSLSTHPKTEHSIPLQNGSFSQSNMFHHHKIQHDKTIHPNRTTLFFIFFYCPNRTTLSQGRG